jgi:hypothetical protein
MHVPGTHAATTNKTHTASVSAGGDGGDALRRARIVPSPTNNQRRHGQSGRAQGFARPRSSVVGRSYPLCGVQQPPSCAARPHPRRQRQRLAHKVHRPQPHEPQLVALLRMHTSCASNTAPSPLSGHHPFTLAALALPRVPTLCRQRVVMLQAGGPSFWW